MDFQDFPYAEELRPAPDVAAALRQFAAAPRCILFDSAQRHPELGRYSFLAADPFAWIEIDPEGARPFARLDESLAPFSTESLPHLPPFQGGAAGLFAYDLGRSLERLPAPRWDEFQAPALAVGLYDLVLAWDHAHDRAWIVSQGFPETEPAQRRRRALARIAEARQWLAAPRAAPYVHKPTGVIQKPVPLADLAPQFLAGGDGELLSNFSREAYLAAVARAIEYVRAGDIFQVNVAQRLLYPAHDESLALYLRLRERNPAPFAGYFDLGDFQIASASPERFLAIRAGEVEARPIKGTRARYSRPEADLFAADDLRQSEKDRAENVMIVDLLRNDLSRVCTPESIRVTQLCGLESYATVQHLVSVIRGRLPAECGALDLLQAAFPGGSITGAPKVRAMEIIAELEPTARGAYCGSLGYVGFDGALDTSILIRTITAGRGWRQLPVGGGIVAQSDPESEYLETWHKAEGMLRALRA